MDNNGDIRGHMDTSRQAIVGSELVRNREPMNMRGVNRKELCSDI